MGRLTGILNGTQPSNFPELSFVCSPAFRRRRAGPAKAGTTNSRFMVSRREIRFVGAFSKLRASSGDARTQRSALRVGVGRLAGGALLHAVAFRPVALVEQ